MKLSEAIRIGYNEIKPTNSCWLQQTDEGCQGCAIGAALMAMGKRHVPVEVFDNFGIEEVLEAYWPWVFNEPLMSADISEWFGEVLVGASTMDELIQKVEALEAKHEVVEKVSVAC